jgi:DNA-binding transcriptional LysR family regulator
LEWTVFMPWDDRVRRRLKLRDLDILMAVVAAGGMGKAATRLGMSQPAVSKAIVDLEGVVGARLLERSRRGIEPTQYGRALVNRGVAVFDELRQGILDIEFLADPSAGEVRIGTTEPIAAAIVAPVVKNLSRQYPRMIFHIVASDTATLLRELAGRNVELMISRLTSSIGDEYLCETLFQDELIVATGMKNVWARKRRVSLAELTNEPWVQSEFLRTLQVNVFRSVGLQPPPRTITSSSVNLRNELLATGDFFCLLPGFSLRLPRRHTTLKALPVSLSNMRHPVCIVYLKSRSLSPPAQLFIDHVRDLTKLLANS